MKKENKRYIILVILIILIVILEQGIKNYIVENYKDQGPTNIIEDIMNITYVENTGGAWGIGQNDLTTFIIANILVIGIIIRFIVTQKDRIGTVTLTSLILILAGGISNFLDRIIRGYVVDYIDITPLFNFPVFNIDDVIIIIGWILFIALVSISTIKLKNEKVEDRIEKDNSK